MINGVGWIIDNGSITKAGSSVSTVIPGDYAWNTYSGGLVNSPAQVQSVFDSIWLVRDGNTSEGCITSTTQVVCTYKLSNGAEPQSVADLVGFGCTAPRTYVAGACVTAVSTALLPSDLSVLDGFVKNKDGTWQRDLATQMCGSLESCYKALLPSTVLTGPPTVSGKPQTVTTTSPSGATTVSVKTPTTTVTYGPNWYDYNPVTTTTTTNNGGTTTTTNDAPQTFPNVPDMLGGANGGLGGINDGLPGTTSTTSPIPYMAWYSFSQQCSEITLVIPVHGPFSTAICPVYATYIWPTLYFFFAVFTWIRCWGIWRDTVLRVRAS
jgi:hypothetical protein